MLFPEDDYSAMVDIFFFVLVGKFTTILSSLNLICVLS